MFPQCCMAGDNTVETDFEFVFQYRKLVTVYKYFGKPFFFGHAAVID